MGFAFEPGFEFEPGTAFGTGTSLVLGQGVWSPWSRLRVMSADLRLSDSKVLDALRQSALAATGRTYSQAAVASGRIALGRFELAAGIEQAGCEAGDCSRQAAWLGALTRKSGLRSQSQPGRSLDL